MAKAAEQLRLPSFPFMVRRFLHQQLNQNSSSSESESWPAKYPNFDGKVKIFYSAVATFRAPSDPSGITGMHREYIRAMPSWRGAP